MQGIETKTQLTDYINQFTKEIDSFYDKVLISILLEKRSIPQDEIDRFKEIRVGKYDYDPKLLIKIFDMFSNTSLVQGELLGVLEKLKEKAAVIQNSMLFMTGIEVAEILSTPNIAIKSRKEDNYDLVIDVGRDKTLPFNFPQEVKAGEFYFDKTELPSYLRSPEMIDVLSKKCFIRSTETANGWDLKPEYHKDRTIAPDSDPHMHHDLRLKLTDPLINAIYKSLTEKDLGHKYALIGPTGYETESQRIENFILSGRADRVVSEGPTGPGEEHTASIILREFNKNIKTVRIMRQSFPLNGKYERVSKYDRWIRMVVD